MKSKELAAPKLVYGVGRNDADYAVRKFETIGCVNGKQKQKLVWVCPYYRTWHSMLSRCYSIKAQNRRPTYKGCSVSDDWLTFSVFKSWMEKQDWEGKQLDKDLLFEGNKVYSADACVFVTQMVNTFVCDGGAARGEWLIGVHWCKKKEKLGYFTCEQQAHNAWKRRKLELAKELAAIQADEKVAEALIARYTNYKTH